MSATILLLKDPIFLTALAVFMVGAGVLAWCLAGLKSLAMPEISDDLPPSRRDFRLEAPPTDAPPPPMTPPAALPMPPPSSPAASTTSQDNDASVMYSLLEERFTDLSKRIAGLEGGKQAAAKPVDAAPPAAALEPLAKRLKEVEEEIIRVKLLLSEMPAPAAGQPPGDLSALSAKVDGIQRVIESLTSDTDVGKTT